MTVRREPSVLSGAVTEDGEWIGAEEAARHLNLKPHVIYRLVHEGVIPARRFPVQIRRRDLDVVLERCRIKPGELAHLNPYAGGAHLSLGRSVTRRGKPDRRFGPRIERRDLSGA